MGYACLQWELTRFEAEKFADFVCVFAHCQQRQNGQESCQTETETEQQQQQQQQEMSHLARAGHEEIRLSFSGYLH